MAQASFYYNVASREQALCQLVGKAVKRKLATGVLTGNEADSMAVDRLLWEIPSTGFVPHCLADQPVAAATPAWIHHELDALLPRDVLFNWSDQAVPADRGIARIVEIVPRDDDGLRQIARQRLAYYKQAGYEIEFTDMLQLAKG
ncbi:DNA polymerase III subunit chi [Chitinimonas sp. BJYL2]|uniref:DNA polymerase III subunit chi n=1 Tax=Chitinimonas sp. BJYL2 TaxID=2976696 RepID=UPI0022B56452|nr:DNA polymerase III subunit chi [Chitinimonas sp. BJYL2]